MDYEGYLENFFANLEFAHEMLVLLSLSSIGAAESSGIFPQVVFHGKTPHSVAISG